MKKPQQSLPPIPTETQCVPIGRFFSWLILRFVAPLWSVGMIFILSAPAERVTPPRTWLSSAFFAAGVIVINLVAHPLAYGKVCKDGVWYRRYFQGRFTSWQEFEAVRCDVNVIDLVLRGGGSLFGCLRFLRRDPPWPLFTKERPKEPELVSWIGYQIELASHWSQLPAKS